MLLSALLFGKPSAAGPDGTGDPDADEPADLGDEAGDVDDDDDDDDDGDDDDDAAAARQSGPSTSVKVLQAGLRSILVAWHLHEAVKHASDVAKWELKQPKMERNLRRNAARMWRAAPDMAGRLAWVNALSRQTRHASIFDEDETEMIKACLAHSISGGFPVDSGSLQELMRTLVVANDIRNGRGSHGGDPAPVLGPGARPAARAERRRRPRLRRPAVPRRRGAAERGRRPRDRLVRVRRLGHHRGDAHTHVRLRLDARTRLFA